ncbi:MAG: helix-turn-helix domain-containing protein [Cytophagales bacterium]|nr:helix-turn-helix domain-containing protein [Cytophagales bacterium]
MLLTFTKQALQIAYQESKNWERFGRIIAESANFKVSTFNKLCIGLIGKCFKMPNAPYSSRYVHMDEMNYQEKNTNGFISNFVKSYWEYDNKGPECSYELLPDGYFDLIFQIQKEQLTKIWLTGVWTEQVTVKIPANTRLIGARFKLIATEYIFRQSIKSIRNKKTDFPKDFFGTSGFSSMDFENFTSTLSQKLLYGLKSLKEIDNRKFEFFQTLYERKGEVTVKELAEQVHWNSRQINRYFNSRFGFPLKTFGNILKCHSSLKHIAKGKLFPENDYFDQAHFIKKVKQFTGTTPTELYLNKNDRFLQLATLREA